SHHEEDPSMAWDRPRPAFVAPSAGRSRWGLLFVWLLLVGVGGVLILNGVWNMRISEGATESPQVLTVEQLVANGPQGNNHVELAGWILGDRYIIHYEKSKGKSLEELFG